MLLVSGNGFCEEAAVPINLPRVVAIAMAFNRNPDLRIEAYNTEMAKKDLAKSWGIYNPVLNLNGSGGITSVPGDAFFLTKFSTTTLGLTQNLPFGGSITASTQTGFFSLTPGTSNREWQSTAGLSATLPLLKNFGMENTQLSITLGANSLADAVERFRGSASETVATVLNSYKHLYVLRRIQETRVAALNSAQKLRDEINKTAQQGPVQNMETANAEFSIAQRRKDVVEASRNVRDQEVNLRYQLGLESQSEIYPIDPPSKEEPQLTDPQAVQAALALRTDLKQLQISLKTSQLQERIARRQALPDLSLTATGGVSGTGNNIGSYANLWKNPGNYWTAGVQFSAPLGNTALRNDYLKSKIRTEQLEEQVRSLRWKIQNDVEIDMRALISARLQMQFADKSRELSEQRLDAYRKNNAVGTASIQDVINAENDFNSASNAQLEAVETFSNAVIKLWKDTGVLLDHYNVHVDVSAPAKITEGGIPGRAGTSLAAAGKEQAAPGSEYLKATDQSPAPGRPIGAEAAAVKSPAPELVAPVPVSATAPAQPTAGTTPSAPPPAIPQKEVKAEPQPEPQAASAGATGSAAPAEQAVPGSYTLKIGEYVDKAQMVAAVKKIKQAGLAPTVKEGPKKKTAVIRLYLAEFGEQEAAGRELSRLHAAGAHGFTVKTGEQKYTVYAGSLFDQKSALQEQARLSKHGIKTTLKNVSVALPTFELTAGTFPSREAAQENAAKLEKQHLKAAVQPLP